MTFFGFQDNFTRRLTTKLTQELSEWVALARGEQSLGCHTATVEVWCDYFPYMYNGPFRCYNKNMNKCFRL